jgi:hypothetical protein
MVLQKVDDHVVDDFNPVVYIGGMLLRLNLIQYMYLNGHYKSLNDSINFYSNYLYIFIFLKKINIAIKIIKMD